MCNCSEHKAIIGELNKIPRSQLNLENIGETKHGKIGRTKAYSCCELYSCSTFSKDDDEIFGRRDNRLERQAEFQFKDKVQKLR